MGRFVYLRRYGFLGAVITGLLGGGADCVGFEVD